MDLHEKLSIDAKNHFKISINTFKKGWMMDYHWHNAIEISYSIKGTKREWIENEQYNITGNHDLLLINSGLVHKIDADAGRIGLVLLIESDFVSYYSKDFANSVYNLNRNEAATNRIKEILQELYEKYIHEDIWVVHESEEVHYQRMDYESPEQIYVCSKVIEIIYLMDKYLKEPKKKVSNKQLDKSRKVKEMINYIHTHYKEELDLKTLSKEFGYSPAYLSTFFKEVTEMSIINYIHMYRLGKSLKYLKNNKEESITSVANHVGFKDVKSYNTMFKKVYKMTPMEYRKNCE